MAQPAAAPQRSPSPPRAPRLIPPQVPRLAPDVRLSGRLEDSAFAQQQWLVERGDNFVQVTELLYQVLQEIDGRRSIDEIARRVSARSRRDVSGTVVRGLIGKLIPLGVVANGDGQVFDMPTAGRSPLALNLKMAMFPASVTNTITDVFKWLFLPPVVVAVLALSLAAHVWLYGGHGIAQAVHQALYAPSLLLVIFAGAVISAAFHELGHGAGLRYGGGRVRNMGVGLYLVYPAFYTDVTDNYRLGRGKRLRTDFGGFYFNAVFHLLMVGLFFLTAQEFWLLIALIVDLEVVQQLLPLVRVDGYWILADLTGIPDFFTQMGSFVRGVVPWLKRDPQRQLPELKWWGKIVFALYIVLVVPLLAFLLFTMIRSFPRVAATAGDSTSKQLATLGGAFAHTDVIALAASILQLVLLAIPVIGLAIVIVSVLRSWLRLLWRWSKGSTPRRGVASVAGLATFAFLAFLWLPEIPSLGLPRGPLAVPQAYVPISTEERGTITEAVGVKGNLVPDIPRPSASVPAASAPASASAAPSASASPSASGSPSASASPSPTPSATPSSSP